MLNSLLYVVVRFLLEVLIVRGRSDARLRAEVLALRHQLAVLERQAGRPRWRPDEVTEKGLTIQDIRTDAQGVTAHLRSGASPVVRVIEQDRRHPAQR